ncbi:MAG: translation elongation factor Ts [Anaerovoracaceae bacterium]|jgi:elongation factor Ts|nr:translation elongation factor Ts [Eubacteriales bacterium]MDD3290467.1 translation elongation factor Ts [Eubacteriales bacterium]MDD3864307.1 translation elongation factor Ts [Eubacteriales bacterium]MDD4444841.1 translation elongation factor Ts [Eubacteriales bacterium]
MAVTAAMVKELREATGAGMMDCKKALTETDGNMEKAVDYLRENGLAKAAKKAGRVASEGLVRLAFNEDATQAAAIEVNSETDFVAKNEAFVSFVETLSQMALNGAAESMEAFMALPYGSEGTVQDALNNMIAKIGENLSVRRFVKFNTAGVKYAGYVHGGGKIGVVIGIQTEATADEISIVGKDVAMQAASMRPQFVDESEVDPEYLEHEKQILVAQALHEGKPAEIVEKMVIGRLKKELKETCLVEQKFVKNNDMSVKDYVEAVAKDLGKDMKIVEMLRYEVGEGIEKKEENFAEEVAKQMGK